MALVAIEEQHLINMADALRGHLGNMRRETKTVNCFICKSPNAVSHTEWQGICPSGSTEFFKYTVPNATTVTVNISYQFANDGYVYVMQGDRDSYSLDNGGRKFTGETLQTAELVFEGDTTTIGGSFGRTSADVLGYYAEIRGYDADGNEIPTEDSYEMDVWASYKPRDMVTAVESMNSVPEDKLTITGNCNYKFAYSGWDWFLLRYADKITVQKMTKGHNMFESSTLTNIPIVISMEKDYMSLSHMLKDAKNLTVAPTIRVNLVAPNVSQGLINISNMFSGCTKLRDVENVFDPDELDKLADLKVTSSYSPPYYNHLFYQCSSLRRLPLWFYKLRFSKDSTAHPSASYSLYYNAFYNCYVLDEVNNLPVVDISGAQTSNMFQSTFNNCQRLKNMTFETNEDGTPKVVKWKAQVIDLSGNFGTAATTSNMLDYNSGLTMDTRVTDDATYQALKNDPDWWSQYVAYSRYNHDSAVATINSLPDTSAYLTSAGGTNTIKFNGKAGSSTDGGAVNTLTEEEIAIATSRGWTVSFA